MIFASDFGIKQIGVYRRWQSDGTFFSAPKPFTQAYYKMGGKPNEKLKPCVFVLQTKEVSGLEPSVPSTEAFRSENQCFIKPKTRID